MMKNKRYAFIFCVCAVMLVFLGMARNVDTASKGGSCASSSETPKVVLVYVQEENARLLRDEDAAYITQMNLSFGLIVDGQVSVAHMSGLNAAIRYAQAHPHIELGLAVGGWGADGFSQAASSVQNREAFAASAIEVMTRYGFTTLDIDWEYPGSGVAGIASTSADMNNFVLLLTEIRSQMNRQTVIDGTARRLTVAMGGAWQASQQRCNQIASLCDQINVMTYDMLEGKADHHTALYGTQSVDTAIKAYQARGVPADRLVIGCAFYGYGWTCAQGQSSGKRSVYSYAQIMRLDGYTPMLDEAAQAAYLVKDGAFISYDSPESIRAKADYVDQQGLMGIMAWSYGKDTTGELLRAMNGE